MYAVQPLYNVRQLECSAFAFAAILNNGKVVTWGQEEDGGDSFLANQILEIQKKTTRTMDWNWAFSFLFEMLDVCCYFVGRCGKDNTWESLGVGISSPDPEVPAAKKLSSSISANKLPRFGGDQTMQVYDTFEAFPLQIVLCLGWCHIFITL